MSKDQLIKMVQDLKDENDQLKEMNQQLQKQLEEIQSELVVTRNTSELLSKRITDLERRSSQQEQYSRRECLEFSNIPQTVSQDNLEEKVRHILRKIEVAVESEQIEACHRVGKHGTTIVKFSRRKDVSKILANKKKLKDIDSNTLQIPEGTRIYINESLCQAYRDLWIKSKILWKKGKIASFWSSNGTVKLKIKSLSNAVSITHIDDLKELLPEIDFDKLY